MSLHHTAGPILPCSDHAVAHGHVHGGARAGVMSVEETGAVLVLSHQPHVQEVLKQTAVSLLVSRMTSKPKQQPTRLGKHLLTLTFSEQCVNMFMSWVPLHHPQIN